MVYKEICESVVELTVVAEPKLRHWWIVTLAIIAWRWYCRTTERSYGPAMLGPFGTMQQMTSFNQRCVPQRRPSSMSRHRHDAPADSLEGKFWLVEQTKTSVQSPTRNIYCVIRMVEHSDLYMFEVYCNQMGFTPDTTRRFRWWDEKSSSPRCPMMAKQASVIMMTRWDSKFYLTFAPIVHL
jgi:hypothetical protein